jgi:hypothetical protein
MRAPEVLNPKVKVEDEASLFRSGRKGSVVQARNMQIPKTPLTRTTVGERLNEQEEDRSRWE